MLDSNNGKALFDDHLNFTVCSITCFLPMVLMGIVPSSLKTSSGSNRFTATNPLLFCSILAISLLPTGILTSLQSNISSCFSLKIAHSVRIRFVSIDFESMTLNIVFEALVVLILDIDAHLFVLNRLWT